MLTKEFCVRGKFWEKEPHSPASKCGRCVQDVIVILQLIDKCGPEINCNNEEITELQHDVFIDKLLEINKEDKL
jgi:hypothetical protein